MRCGGKGDDSSHRSSSPRWEPSPAGRRVAPSRSQRGIRRWRRATMASALTARHIGGAVNYVSVAEYVRRGRAAGRGHRRDNAVVAPYFVGCSRRRTGEG